MILRTTHLRTPAGACWLAVSPHGLCALGLGPRAGEDLTARLARRFAAARPRFEATRDPDGVASRLAAYFAGERGLEDLPLDLGGTPFQARVWQALRAIPLGASLSYAALAESLGTPSAIRAVAGANARNPVSLAVPCHRVIGKDGSLTGYAWGTDAKAWLLAHEARWASRRAAPVISI
jgi:O-6-methylguanine DNA methyltransferase